MPHSENTAPPSIDPQRLEALHNRVLEVAIMIGAAHPSTYELVERMRELAGSADPWRALDERSALTAVAARLHACSQALLGPLGEHELDLPDGDELAASLADRGVLIPRKCSVFKRKNRRQ